MYNKCQFEKNLPLLQGNGARIQATATAQIAIFVDFHHAVSSYNLARRHFLNG
jgi:hypothetical protein